MLRYPNESELINRIRQPDEWSWGPIVGIGVPVLLLLVAAFSVYLCAISARDAIGGPMDDDFFGDRVATSGPLPTVDPETPLEQLLPTAPKWRRSPVYVGADLTRVPESKFEAAAGRPGVPGQGEKRLAWTVAAALHLNQKEEDGYLKAMLRTRPDLEGLPFLMGQRCRTGRDDMERFKRLAEDVHRGKPGGWLDSLHAEAENGASLREVARVHMAAVRQIKGPSGGGADMELARYLAGVPLAEATDELARLAVFSTDEVVRKAALRSLSVRREADSTKALAQALRYPWPQVARNAVEAIVKLKRKGMVSQLVDVLEAPDPRAPREEKGEVVASELVRVNHLRSCLLCHAPATLEKRGEQTSPIVAEVPVPSQRLPDTSEGYGRSSSNLLVRVDVTYLRQDFSVMQEVADAAPWPDQQRFDFLVRRRVLNKAEAEGLRRRLEAEKRDGLSPYQHAAYWALRDLTKRDLPPKAEAWREALKLKPS
jgi:hypothetical protein